MPSAAEGNFSENRIIHMQAKEDNFWCMHK